MVVTRIEGLRVSETDLVLEIDHPHFIIRVTKDLLKIDVKGNVKNEIEEALENNPGLRKTIDRILSVFVPLHISLSDIGSVKIEKTGDVKIVLPHHRNAKIPLE